MCREDVIKYFRTVKAAMNAESGSIFVLDLLGGHAAESVAKLKRQNRVTGEMSCHPNAVSVSGYPLPIRQGIVW